MLFHGGSHPPSVDSDQKIAAAKRTEYFRSQETKNEHRRPRGAQNHPTTPMLIKKRARSHPRPNWVKTRASLKDISALPCGAAATTTKKTQMRRERRIAIAQQRTHAPTRNKRALSERKREDNPTIPPYNCQRTTTRLSAQIGPGHGTHTIEKNFPPLGLERKKPPATTYTVKESKKPPPTTREVARIFLEQKR